MEPSHNHTENEEMSHSADNLPAGNEKALLDAAQLTHRSFADLEECADP